MKTTELHGNGSIVSRPKLAVPGCRLKDDQAANLIGEPAIPIA
jgi:hypothetical protein